MIAILLGLTVTCVLPGWVLFHLPVAGRERRAGLDADERAFWIVVLSVIITSAVTLSLALAGRYQYQRLLAVDAIGSLAVVLGYRRRLAYTSSPTRPRPAALAPLAIIVASAWLYFPPSEYVMGGKDPGTYVNEGIQLAQRGRLVVADPVVAQLPAGLRDLFFPQYTSSEYFSTRFMGFFVLAPSEGTVVGQFPHLFPSWIAIGYGINGLSGARQAVCAWAVLAVLAVFFAARHSFGPWAAAATGALVLANIVQLWFARYPNAEIPMQALVFAGLLAYARSVHDGDRFFAPVAASAFGLLLFLKPVDAVLVFAALAATIVLVGWNARRWPTAGFWWPLGLWSAAAVGYLLVVLGPYAQYPLLFVRNLSVVNWALIALGLGVGAGALAWLRKRPGSGADFVPLALVCGIVILAGYAYFVRQPGGRTAEHDAMALRSFAWYVSRLGLAGALVGFAFAVRRTFWRAPFLPPKVGGRSSRARKPHAKKPHTKKRGDKDKGNDRSASVQTKKQSSPR